MQNIEDWHNRFLHQSKWTEDLVDYTLKKASITKDASIAEIGCGTGAMFEKIPAEVTLMGFDIDYQRLQFAQENFSNKILVHGDGLKMAIMKDAFDLVFCHYLLLWVTNPFLVLSEMKRITKPGGWIAIFAEPDYRNRIDSPKELEFLGKAQNKSLIKQGVNINIGSLLPSLFSSLNLDNVEIGKFKNIEENVSEEEWQMLEFDLSNSSHPATNNALKKLSEMKHSQYSKNMHIPTYFAIGSKRRNT